MKKSCRHLYYLIIIAFTINSYQLTAQGIAINQYGLTADSSALLDVSSTSKGLLIPRMTTAERNAISNPASSLLIYNTTTKCFEFFENNLWQSIICSCTPPNAPIENIHTPTEDEITWNWHQSVSATGYKWNTVNDYGTAVDLGTDTSYNETSLTCNTAYTRYIWAYNSCGGSSVTIINKTTTSCPASCGTPLNDIRDTQSYSTILIGTQCWMAQNLNYDQSTYGNDYCYDNNPANCTTYGRLYDWAAAMQGAPSSNSIPSNVQGVCPTGWHLPSDAEWCILENYVESGIDPTCSNINWRGSSAGGSLKETGTAHWLTPNAGATNSSGFTGLPGGSKDVSLGYFNFLNTGYFQVATEVDASKAWRRALAHNAASMCRNNTGVKTLASSVRCIKD